MLNKLVLRKCFFSKNIDAKGKLLRRWWKKINVPSICS